MKVSVEVKPPAKPGFVNAHFVTKEDRAATLPGVSEKEFSAAPHSLLYLRDSGTLYVGVGSASEVQPHRVRTAAGAVVMHLRKIGQRKLALVCTAWPQYAGAAVEGALIADYRFEQFQPEPTPLLECLQVQVAAEDLAATRRAVQRSSCLAEATNASRDVGNLPGNHLYPEELAAHAARLGRQYGFKLTVWDELRLQREGFGGILAVGQGSVRPPRMLVLEHRGGKRGERPLALVGKAITFDTGGISIKPAASMEEMIFDKSGGIAVLGAMCAIAALKVPKNIVAVIASAENMPSGAAYRPGDIVKAYDGTHIEVLNTDAEGRVVLGDAIAYARQNLKAKAIVDLATLTGACGVALGECAAGLWTNDDTFGAAVRAASERAGERLWLMPSYAEYDQQIKSDVGQLKNTGGRLGGACTAAAFLKAFARDVSWAHLDIAYMANRDKDQAHMARGATGFGVRTLLELAEAWTERQASR